MSKIIPLPGYVLIEPEKDDNKTASGIMLPDSSQDVPDKGKVLAVGGASNYIEIKEGALINVERNMQTIETKTVFFRKYSGQTVKQDGKELKLVKFDDLLAVIE